MVPKTDIPICWLDGRVAVRCRHSSVTPPEKPYTYVIWSIEIQLLSRLVCLCNRVRKGRWYNSSSQIAKATLLCL